MRADVVIVLSCTVTVIGTLIHDKEYRERFCELTDVVSDDIEGRMGHESFR